MKHSASTTRAEKSKCRKRHEDRLCPEEQTCTSKECSFRHPKHADIFYKEGIFRFGENCFYAHKKVNTKDNKFEEIKEKYENEINNIKDEMKKLKETVSVMQNKITELNQEIQSSKTNNIS